MSAAVSLSQSVLDDGQAQVDRYLGFLKSGGAQFPLPTLQAAGVDMTTPAPIEHTLRLFASEWLSSRRCSSKFEIRRPPLFEFRFSNFSPPLALPSS